jgi:hypothetical protein
MMNHYALEQRMKFEQKEIEQQGRQAWKWLNNDSEKPSKNDPPVNSQPVAVCCPACC